MSEGVKVAAPVRASQSPGPAFSFGDWNAMSTDGLSRALNNFRATSQTIVEAFMLAVLERALAAHHEAALKYGLIAVASTRRSMTAEVIDETHPELFAVQQEVALAAREDRLRLLQDGILRGIHPLLGHENAKLHAADFLQKIALKNGLVDGVVLGTFDTLREPTLAFPEREGMR